MLTVFPPMFAPSGDQNPTGRSAGPDRPPSRTGTRRRSQAGLLLDV
jgi:hypothetical protein